MERDVVVEIWRANLIVELKKRMLGGAEHAPTDNFIQHYIDAVEHITSKTDAEKMDFALQIGFGAMGKFIEAVCAMSSMKQQSDGADRESEDSLESVVGKMDVMGVKTKDGRVLYFPKTKNGGD